MLSAMELLDLSLVAPERLRPISRAEYDRMVALGIIEEDEKVELLRGAIVTMSPQSEPHMRVIVWLDRLLVRALPDEYDVRPQGPFAADDWSEPEPDFAITRREPERRDHPREALLIIEVSVSSLHKDRHAKQIIYAENGVPEYWVVDAARATVEVFTQLAKGGYRQHVVLRDGDVLRPHLLPQISIPISEMPR